MLTLALAVGACKKDAAEKPKADTTTASTSTSTPSTTPSTTTPTETAGTGSPFKSDEGKFSIVVPAGFTSPSETVSPMSTPSGNVDLKMYSATSGNTAAMFAFADMNGKLDMKGKEKVMLDGARDNVLKTMNGALLKKEKSITIDGHPGRRILISMKPGRGIKLYGRLEMYLVDPIMYQVMYVSDKRASLESPAVNDFFSSFTLR
jgi:hypothetical protein